MSKSKGNTVDPDAVFKTHGADAIRWYFLTGAPAGNSRRVGQPGSQEDPVGIVHGFFNMLINSAGFFALYANIDRIRLNGTLDSPIADAPPFGERPEIDRWILSSLQKLIVDVDHALTDYDSQRAGKRIEEFTEGLSNWYIRRNRRRFWKGELDADKLGAYDTLHRCIVTVARLIAPFAPFLAEELYRALTIGLEGAPESVHLSGWPAADFEKMYDTRMLEEGDLIQSVAELGRAARMQSGVKVRQPLSKLMIHVSQDGDKIAIEKSREVLLEELNVKALEFLDDSAGIIDYRIRPNLPRIGKRLGSKIRSVQEFLQKGEPTRIARDIRAGRVVQIPDGAQSFELEAEDFLLESISREGSSAVEGKGVLVALDTTLSPALIEEGIVRDLVRNIQELRKRSGLNVTDRIYLHFSQIDDETVRALTNYREYVESETLSEVISGERSGRETGMEQIKLDRSNPIIKIWKMD
jgi:isoleucyl-tRNA synthetase